jgi:hypothetical protein
VPVRITKIIDVDNTVLKVDGRLRLEDVGELARVVRSVQGAAALDLSELQTADRAGVEILRELASLGVELRGTSPYIELLLKTKS